MTCLHIVDCSSINTHLISLNFRLQELQVHTSKILRKTHFRQNLPEGRFSQTLGQLVFDTVVSASYLSSGIQLTLRRYRIGRFLVVWKRFDRFSGYQSITVDLLRISLP